MFNFLRKIFMFDNNTGDWNTGNSNTGDSNTGDWNTGNRNTGDWNTGNRNTGDWNTGDWNTGNSNTGDWNTGNRNTGNRNTGDWNTGDSNTGDWNTGNRNTGMFNTNEPKARFFNKDSDWKMSDFLNSELCPSSYGFYLTKWVDSTDMSDKEKQDNPTYKTTGGYLKEYSYKEAWVNFWAETDEDNKNKFLNLPNFDSEIFKEITGIDVNEKQSCDGKVVEIDGKKYKLQEL